MKKNDNIIFRLIKIIYLIFVLSSIGLLLCFIFLRNIDKNITNILGIIYLIVIVITSLATLYCTVKGFLFAQKEKQLKFLIKESLSSALFALLVIIIYSLLLYHKIVIGNDYIIIIVFFIIPAFRNYFDKKKI